MNLELDLLDNSYDFLNNALFYYNSANLDEGHEEGQADLETKKQWKTGFILLVQSMELLLKEVLRRTNAILVYENIDIPISSDMKTVSFQKAVQRIINLKNALISSEQRDFILNCGEIRNKFIHYKVEYNSIEIKRKFCKLVEIYSEIHRRTIRTKVVLWKNNEFFYKDSIKKAKDFYVYRGIEFSKKELEKFKKEIKTNSEYNYYYDENDNVFPRIKFGSEEDGAFSSNDKYCPDCIAKLGEYHMDLCDIEQCPKCGGQLLSCDCIKGMCYIEEAEKE